MKDTLYLLPPGFEDNDRREYCPECVEMWGLLSWFPAIKDSLTIAYMPIEKPRAEMVERLGAAHQNCPTLVLHPDSPQYDACGIQTSQGHAFINNARDIGVYYHHHFGTPWPRGHKV